MGNQGFRERVAAELAAKGWSKADLARHSGVGYHTIDKWLKGTTSSTSTENATKIARALGIRVDESAEADALRALYFDVPEEKRSALLESVRALVRGWQKDQ
jgi:transcriptional regulator with XRE-family HTH domain